MTPDGDGLDDTFGHFLFTVLRSAAECEPLPEESVTNKYRKLACDTLGPTCKREQNPRLVGDVILWMLGVDRI